VDANEQALAYVYAHADVRAAEIAKVLTEDEARRIASNITSYLTCSPRKASELNPQLGAKRKPRFRPRLPCTRHLLFG
jgi:hypothetical protein